MGYQPPYAMSADSWQLFAKEFRKEAPVRYYITKTFHRKYILPVIWKCDSIRHWVRYRTWDKYHVLQTGLEPGYYSVSNIMLHSNFNLLKNFVEQEQAWSKYMWSEERVKNASWFEKYMPFYFIFKPFCRPDLGIQHFEWAATLDDPSLPVYDRAESQAIAAREVLVLYKWWVDIRPSRVEITYLPPHNDDGSLSVFNRPINHASKAVQDYIENQKNITEQADNWDNEDESMLFRLIKIRDSLWS